MNWTANVNDKARFDHPFALEKRLVLNLTKRPDRSPGCAVAGDEHTCICGILQGRCVQCRHLGKGLNCQGAQARNWRNYQSISALGSSSTKTVRCFVRPVSVVVQHVHHPVSWSERSLPVLCLYTVYEVCFGGSDAADDVRCCCRCLNGCEFADLRGKAFIREGDAGRLPDLCLKSQRVKVFNSEFRKTQTRWFELRMWKAVNLPCVMTRALQTLFLSC